MTQSKTTKKLYNISKYQRLTEEMNKKNVPTRENRKHTLRKRKKVKKKNNRKKEPTPTRNLS